MSENFGHPSIPKTPTNLMSGENVPKPNAANSFAQPGFLTPTPVNAPKPSTNLFTSTPASSAAKSANTTGNHTIFSWPNSTSTPPTTTASFLNFKSSSAPTTTGGLILKAPAPATIQNKPLASTNPSLGSNAAATTTNLTTFGSPAAPKPTTTTASTTFNLVKPTSTTTSNPIGQTTSSTTPVTSTLGITSSTALSTTSLSSSTLTAKTATSIAPVSTTAASQPQSLTFQQLEELILNKWTSELYEQEKVFLNQATQINIWDKIINENAEKLSHLHSTMEKVRKQQTKINDDLDVIKTHQKDLELTLVPLEKEDLLSVLKADPNRKNLYTNAKKIDTQIKSMSENLKETIEHINETSRSHDSEDPVIQVGRILNAHMESLRWIDEHTARMQDYFDSLLKVHDDLRRECDLNKHDVY